MAEFDFDAFQRLVTEQFADLREQIDAYRTEQIAMRKEMREGFASLGTRADRVHSDLAALIGSVGSLVALAGGQAADIVELRRRVEDIERQRRDDR